MKKLILTLAIISCLMLFLFSKALAQFQFPSSSPLPNINASTGFNGIWETSIHDGNPTENGITEFPVEDFCMIIVGSPRQPHLVRLTICANGSMIQGRVKVVSGKIKDVGKRRNVAVIGNESPANKPLKKAKIISTLLSEDKLDSNGDSRFATLVLRRGNRIYNSPLSVYEVGDIETDTVNDLAAMGIVVQAGDLVGAFSGNFSTCPDEFALGIWKKVANNPNCP